MRTDSNEAFASRLRALMEEEGLTQTQLALMVRVAQSRVSDWRAGKAIPQPRVADALAEALKVKTEWLLTGRGARKPVLFMSKEEMDAMLSTQTTQEPEPPPIVRNPAPRVMINHDLETNWKQRALTAEQKLEAIQKIMQTPPPDKIKS